jgi:hypothetical protein
MRNPEPSSEWPWLVGGTLLLLASSASLFGAVLATGGQFPIPVYFVLHFIIPYSCIFAVPLAFWGSFGFLWRNKWFGGLVLGVATSIGYLNCVWFWSNWDVAYLYQGPTLTQALAIANVVGIGAAVALAAAGMYSHSRKMIALAHLLLFEDLALVGFPSLGSYET